MLPVRLSDMPRLPVLALSCVLAGYAGDATAGTVSLIERKDLGATFLYFEGEVTKGDLGRIRALLPKAVAANPEGRVFIAMHSPGGNAWEGLSIGKFIREQGLGTLIPPNG